MSWERQPELSPDEFRDFRAEYRKKSRFLVDESLGTEAARVLRELRWNAVLVGEVGLNGKDDQEVYAYVWRNDRIILTRNTAFLDDGRFPPSRNPGVVVLPEASGSWAALERELGRIHLSLAPYREAHRYTKVHVGEDGEWRIRKWLKDERRHVRQRLRFESNGAVLIWNDTS